MLLWLNVANPFRSFYCNFLVQPLKMRTVCFFFFVFLAAPSTRCQNSSDGRTTQLTFFLWFTEKIYIACNGKNVPRLQWSETVSSLVKIEYVAEGESLCVALMCVKWADRQWTDCRVNTQLLFGPRCTLRLHDSLHVLLIQCALWGRDSFLCLAVHSLLSGGEICTSDSDEFRRRVCAAQTVNTLHRLCFDKLRPDFTFNDARKCLFLNYCTLAVMFGRLN